MTTIQNLMITLLTALLFSVSSWADEQQPSASEPAAVTTQAAGSAVTATNSSAAADTTDLLREDHPDQYKVVKGDTLWGIASRFLKSPWMWPEIWHVNPQIANPHLIFPGDTIKLIYLEGQPRLTVKHGEAGMTYKASADASSEDVANSGEVSSATATSNQETTSAVAQPTPVAKSSDQRLDPSIRVMPLEEPIPSIPLDVIDPFLSGNRVVTSGDLESAPYVVQGSQGHIITGAGAELYAKGNFSKKTTTYGFYRKGKTYVDPATNEILGVQAIDIGTGKLKSQVKDVASVSILRTTQEIRPGDRILVNQEHRVESTFFPSAPEAQIEGKIINVEGGVTQVGAMTVVAINKGARDGLQSGNVLAIYQHGEIVRDPLTDKNVQLLDERAGLLMVFAIFEKMSYALVLSADRPLNVGDVIRKP